MTKPYPDFGALLAELSDIYISDWSDYPDSNWNPSPKDLAVGCWVKPDAPETLERWAEQIAQIAEDWEHPSPAEVISQAARIAAHAAKVSRFNRYEQNQEIKTSTGTINGAAAEHKQAQASSDLWNQESPFLLDPEQIAHLERAKSIVYFFRQAEGKTMAEIFAPDTGSIAEEPNEHPVQFTPEDQAIWEILQAEHASYDLSHLSQKRHP